MPTTFIASVIASVIYKGTQYFVRSTILTEYRERATEFKTEIDARAAIERAKKFSKASIFKNALISPVN